MWCILMALRPNLFVTVYTNTVSNESTVIRVFKYKYKRWGTLILRVGCTCACERRLKVPHGKNSRKVMVCINVWLVTSPHPPLVPSSV